MHDYVTDNPRDFAERAYGYARDHDRRARLVQVTTPAGMVRLWTLAEEQGYGVGATRNHVHLLAMQRDSPGGERRAHFHLHDFYDITLHLGRIKGEPHRLILEGRAE